MNAAALPTSRSLLVPFACVVALGVLAFVAGGADLVDLTSAVSNYPWGVLVIYLSMEVVTALVADTGVMEAAAVRIARASRGRNVALLVLFGGGLFLVSGVLNNLTAVLIALPVIIAVLRAVGPSPAYLASTFALLLAMSNVGGAATPIGDFPAIIIMTSGVTDFAAYLTRAYPLFAATAAALIVVHVLLIRRLPSSPPAARSLAMDFLCARYRYVRIDRRRLAVLGAIIAAMLIAWSVLPASIFPPELVALLGAGLAVCTTVPLGASLSLRDIDLKVVFFIGAVLGIATLVGESGWLNLAADALQRPIQDPVLLLLAVMGVTTVLSGLISAGPTAAAMMPVVLALADGPLAAQSDWLAVAFAASICAGSSLFLWSATAGLLMASKVEDARIVPDDDGHPPQPYRWGVGPYLRYGAIHAGVQFSIAAAWVLVVL